MNDSKTEVTNAISTLAAAELAIIMKPINEFLTALQSPDVNVAAVLQDFAKLQLEVMSDVPALESVGIGNIAADLQKLLNGWINGLTQPGTTPAPSPAPSPAAA